MLIQSFFKLGSFQTCFHCTDAEIVSNCFFLDRRIGVSVWLISSVELDSGLVPLPQALLALHTYSAVWLVWGLLNVVFALPSELEFFIVFALRLLIPISLTFFFLLIIGFTCPPEQLKSHTKRCFKNNTVCPKAIFSLSKSVRKITFNAYMWDLENHALQCKYKSSK